VGERFGAMSRRRSSERCRGVVLSGVADVSFFGAAPTLRPCIGGGLQLEGQRAVKVGRGYWEGETSESLNPMSGSGMKQGQAGESGVTRQEAEKA